jgi:hypothetical protein
MPDSLRSRHPSDRFTGEVGMSTRVLTCGAWVLAWLAGGVVLAQEPNAMPRSETVPSASTPIPSDSPDKQVPETIPAPKPSDSPIAAITGTPQMPPGTVCSPWNGPGGTGCCGPIGGNGPILSELFVRNGVNILIGGGIIKETMTTGFVQSFGGRSLFFNPSGSRAWTAEFGIDWFYNNNSGKADNEYVLEFFPGRTEISNGVENIIPDVSIFGNPREYIRAGVHFAFGRETYMFTPGYQCGKNFRLGWDIGGRWGYSRLNYNVFPEDFSAEGARITFDRVSDVFGTAFFAIHGDVEIPLGPCWTFVTGIRAEAGYNFSDIVLFNSDSQELNMMLNLGLKF